MSQWPPRARERIERPAAKKLPTERSSFRPPPKQWPKSRRRVNVIVVGSSPKWATASSKIDRLPLMGAPRDELRASAKLRCASGVCVCPFPLSAPRTSHPLCLSSPPPIDIDFDFGIGIDADYAHKCRRPIARVTSQPSDSTQPTRGPSRVSRGTRPNWSPEVGWRPI